MIECSFFQTWDPLTKLIDEKYSITQISIFFRRESYQKWIDELNFIFLMIVLKMDWMREVNNENLIMMKRDKSWKKIIIDRMLLFSTILKKLCNMKFNWFCSASEIIYQSVLHALTFDSSPFSFLQNVRGTLVDIIVGRWIFVQKILMNYRYKKFINWSWWDGDHSRTFIILGSTKFVRRSPSFQILWLSNRFSLVQKTNYFPYLLIIVWSRIKKRKDPLRKIWYNDIQRWWQIRNHESAW